MHKNTGTYALRIKKRKSIIYIILYILKYIILRYIISHVQKHPPRRVFSIIYMFIHLMHTRIYVHAPCIYICTHGITIKMMQSCTFAHCRRISRTHACPIRLCTSRMYLYVYLWCLVARWTITQSNNAIIIIFICFYLIVVSLFVTFCDIHCNSLAEFVSSIILYKHNSLREFYILVYGTSLQLSRVISFSRIREFKKNVESCTS